MRLKTYKMSMSIFPKFLTLKWNISRTIWCIEVGDGSFFFSFFMLFHLSLTFFRPEVPFKCILTGNSKQYLEKAYTEEQVNKLSAEEVAKLFSNYKSKLSDQMVKSLGKSIIKMYPMGACAILGMSNLDALSEDLKSNPFLNSTLQRFTCELYCRFGLFLAPRSIGLIMSRHYLSEQGIKNGDDRSDKQTSNNPE